MANPYGLPDDALALRDPGSPIAMRESARQAAQVQADLEYQRMMAQIEKEKALAARTSGIGGGAAGGMKLKEAMELINDPMTPPHIKTALLRNVEQTYGIPPQSETDTPETTPQEPARPKYESPALTGLGNVAGGAAQGLVGLIPGLAGLAGNLTGSETLQQFGAWGAEKAEQAGNIFRTEEGEKARQELFRQISREDADLESIASDLAANPSLVAGIIAEFAAPGGAIGGLAKAAGNTRNLTRLAEVLNKARSGRFITRSAAPAVTSSTLTAAETGNLGNNVYNELIAAGATEQEASAGAQRAVQSPQAAVSALIGAVPIAERIFGSYVRKPGVAARLLRALGIGGAEAIQESPQEGLQKEAENIGLGRPTAEGVPQAQITGGLLGFAAGTGIGLLAPTNQPAGEAGAKPAAGQPAAPGTSPIASFLQRNGTYEAPFKTALRKATKDNPDDLAAAAQQFADFIKAYPAVVNDPASADLIADADAYARTAVEKYTKKKIEGAPAATATPGAAAPAPAGGVETVPATTPVAPVPGAAAPPPAAPVVVGAPAPTVTAPPPGKAMGAQVQQVQKTAEQLNKVAESIPAQMDKAAGDIATVMMGDIGQMTPDQLAAEIEGDPNDPIAVAQNAQFRAQKTLEKMDKLQQEMAAAEAGLRARAAVFARNSARERGASPDVAEMYARRIVFGLDFKRQSASPELDLNEQFRALDAQIAPMFRLRVLSEPISLKAAQPDMLGEFRAPPGFTNRTGLEEMLSPVGTQGAGPLRTDFGPQSIADPLLAGQLDLAQRINRNQSGEDRITTPQGNLSAFMPQQDITPSGFGEAPQIATGNMQGAGPLRTDFGPQSITDPMLAAQIEQIRQQNQAAALQRMQGNLSAFMPNMEPEMESMTPQATPGNMQGAGPLRTDFGPSNISDPVLAAQFEQLKRAAPFDVPGNLSAFMPNMEPEMESMTDQEATEFVKAVMEGDTLKQEEIKAKVSKKRPATAKSEPKPKAKTEKKSEGKGQKSPKA